MLAPFRMVCRDFILPEGCKPCLLLFAFQFAKIIVPYPWISICARSTNNAVRRIGYDNKCVEPSNRTAQRISLSKNPCFHEAKTGVLVVFGETTANMMRKMEFSQLQFAIFFQIHGNIFKPNPPGNGG